MRRAVRKLVKYAAERVLGSRGVRSLGALARRGDSLILAYHNVIPTRDVTPEWDSLHLPLADFTAQIEAIEQTFEIVPLDGLLDADGNSRRPRLAITFDDAYRGALAYGVAELARRGHACTVFVAPAFVGEHSFWWDAIRHAMAADATEGVRNHALASGGRDATVRTWARAEGIPFDDIPDYAAPASLEDLRRATRLGGVALASHSWSHANLTLLDGDELKDELVRPLAWLREHFDTSLPWLAYPYGLSSEHVERALVTCGYRAAVGQQEGWISSASRPFQIPRLNIPAGMSVRGFAARVSGLWP